jgi:hypothetical protein
VAPHQERKEKFLDLAYQVDENTLSGYPDGIESVPFDVLKESYVNHSCDGNCWYEGITSATLGHSFFFFFFLEIFCLFF